MTDTQLRTGDHLRAFLSRIAITVRTILPRDSWLYQRLRLLSRRFVLNNDPAELMVRAFSNHFSDVFFIQVGSNDGEQLDPLRWSILEKKWHGIMIEPVPYVFARLQKNYGAVEGVSLANVAIADREGEMPFYHLREASPEDDLPSYYDALGSFNKDIILKHDFLIPDIADRVITTPVSCTTFTGLMQNHGVEKIDVLHVDTEGYDYEILKQVDFAQWQIPLLIYEHLHLEADDKASCERMLQDVGYELLHSEMDTVALRIAGPTTLPAELTERFRRLQLQHRDTKQIK